jgi:hypothetical protein
VESWYEYWNIRINEENTQAIYFSHQCTPVWAFLALKGWYIPFVKHMKYLGVIFYKKISWKLCIGTIASKDLCIFISIYPILKSEHLSIGTKLIIYKALIKSILTCYVCPVWNSWLTVTFWNCSICKTKFYTSLVTYQSTLWLVIYTSHLKFHIHMILLQNYTGGKQ